jgi:SAM-dependent methyltransferase
LKLAIDGKLTGINEQLESIVFPLEINGAIDSEINKLERIIKPIKNTNKIVSNKTITYYDDSYIKYHHKTNGIDMSEIYRKVRKYVPNGSRILDAGCGIGRDTQYFLQHGFKVTSLDASKKMVELCNEYPFTFCKQNSFETINYPSKFDLVWACASLLHLNKKAFEKAVYNLYKSLKPGGYLYFSLKAVVPQNSNDSRLYFSYTQQELDMTLIDILKMTSVETWSTESGLDTSTIFNNYIYRK